MIVAIVILNITAFLLLRDAAGGGRRASVGYLGVAVIVAVELLNIAPAPVWNDVTCYIGNGLAGIVAVIVAMTDRNAGILKSVLRLIAVVACVYFARGAIEGVTPQSVVALVIILTGAIASVALCDSPWICGALSVAALYVVLLLMPLPGDSDTMRRYLTGCGGLSIIMLGGAISYLLRRSLARNHYASRVRAVTGTETEFAEEWIKRDDADE